MNAQVNRQSSRELRKECRYCLSDDRLEKLIDPCNCEGTMKYVHQECLEDWIKNGNRQVDEIINNKHIKVYITICEICKYKMKYTKTYKNNLFLSVYKMVKAIFGNIKNGFLLVIHTIIIYFFIKRLKLFHSDFMKMFKKSFSFFDPSLFMNVTHSITVLISILFGINDIYMFYKKLFVAKRKCLINFLPKSLEN